MIDLFLQYLQYEKNYSSHTVLSYQTDLLQFKDFSTCETGYFDPAKTDSQLIREWTLRLLESGLSARSVNHKISTLKSFYRFLNQKGILADCNPTKRIISPKTKRNIPYFFKEEEMKTVLDAEQDDTFEEKRDKLIIDLFYQTGIRRTELINLKDKDVDFSNSSISVIGKRNKERIIPIGNHLREDIKIYITLRNKQVNNRDNYLFINMNGKQFYPKKVYLIVKKNMQKVSSLQKCSPHVLRHTFATTLLNHGADLNAVKKALGHTSLAATEVYTHTTFEQLQSIYKQSHPRELKK